MITAERLEQLGLKKAAKDLYAKKARARKLAVAYEHFRYVRNEKVEAYNEKLRRLTFNEKKYTYQQLSFTRLESYDNVPPESVLVELEKAQSMKCGEIPVFDYFEVAHIVTAQQLPDPILFGRIEGCSDRFFIAQWDDDVKITDLIKDNEG